MSKKPTLEVSPLLKSGLTIEASPNEAILYDCDGDEPCLPLQVQFLGGIDRQTAMSSLAKAAELVAGRWGKLVDGTPADDADDPSERVWETIDMSGSVAGYLVTCRYSIDWPIAFVPTRTTANVDEEDASVEAWRIADDPDAILRPKEVPVIDLRAYGRLTSEQATPGFLYGLWLYPIDRSGSRFGDRGHERRCQPYCPELHRRMEFSRREMMAAIAKRTSGPSPRVRTPDLGREVGANAVRQTA